METLTAELALILEGEPDTATLTPQFWDFVYDAFGIEFTAQAFLEVTI